LDSFQGPAAHPSLPATASGDSIPQRMLERSKLKDFTDEFARYRAIGEKAMRQVSDDGLNVVIGPDNNSIAMIARHISGNLLSRFTDFLTTDGEKPWRNRDSEFEDAKYETAAVENMWIKGWDVLEAQVSQLTYEHLEQKVYIRGQAWTVHEALCRSLAHVSYHFGQIVLMARILSEGNWDWISIPKGQSRQYNANPTMEKKPEQ
jgi:Protein of unknown function (DUF1572)